MANQIDSLGCSRRLSHNGLSQQTIMREGVFLGHSLSLSLFLALSLLFPPHCLILPVFNFSALLLSLFSSSSYPLPSLILWLRLIAHGVFFPCFFCFFFAKPNFACGRQQALRCVCVLASLYLRCQADKSPQVSIAGFF